MKIQKIDLFTFTHTQQYGVQHAFSLGLQKSLIHLGISSSLLSYEKAKSGELLAKLLQETPDCTAGFSVTIAKHSPLEPLGIPHLSMIVDSATYFPELLQNPNAIVSFVEEDSVGFFKMFGCKYALCLLHAVDKALLDTADLHKKRDLDVVLCGSYIDADDILATWKDLFSPHVQKCLVETAERVLASDKLSHLQAFVELVEKKDAFEKELIEKNVEFFDVINSVDQYIRGIDRRRIVEALDMPVHIFGAKQYEERWKNTITDSKKLIFHDEVAYTDLPKVLERTKVVINSFPMFKRGLHERLLMALSCGASVLCNQSAFVNDVFCNNPAILNILSPNYDKANDLINAALQHETIRLQQATSTHAIIRQNHTWDSRALQLVQALTPILDELKNK